MSNTSQSPAQFRLEHGNQYPYDDPRWEDGLPTNPARDWAHRAARGILADLTDRRGVGNELEEVDEDVRVELVESLAEIIRQADADRRSEV